LGEALFSAHAAQRELLVLIAAPLLALGRPLAALPWALPLKWRRRLGRASLRAQGSWRTLTTPFATWLIHSAVLWMWSAPSLFQAALESDLARAAERSSILVSAFIFCDALMRGHDRRMSYRATIIYASAACVQTVILGALLASASTVWYPHYEMTSTAWGAWGLTTLEDQHLGGLIMWVSAGVVSAAGGLILVVAWLRGSDLTI